MHIDYITHVSFSQHFFKNYKKSFVKDKKSVDNGTIVWYTKSVVKETYIHNTERMCSMDKALLEYEMKKHNISIGDMCELLNMSRSAFYRKCNGISEFTHSEIQKIVNVLELESPVAIFFSNRVS